MTVYVTFHHLHLLHHLIHAFLRLNCVETVVILRYDNHEIQIFAYLYPGSYTPELVYDAHRLDDFYKSICKQPTM